MLEWASVSQQVNSNSTAKPTRPPLPTKAVNFLIQPSKKKHISVFHLVNSLVGGNVPTPGQAKLSSGRQPSQLLACSQPSSDRKATAGGGGGVLSSYIHTPYFTTNHFVRHLQRREEPNGGFQPAQSPPLTIMMPGALHHPCVAAPHGVGLLTTAG